MDQRWTQRIDTRVPTRLQTRDGEVVSAVIRNISLGGFFVETEQPLDPYSCVDVCVRMAGESGWCTHKVPAVVTHIQSQGAGLMFSAIDRRMRTALGDLTAHRVPASLKFDGLRSMGMPGVSAG